MSEQPISNKTALRIALAAKALPEVSVKDLIEALQNHVGDTLNETSLSKITVTHLKTAFGQTGALDGEADSESLDTGEITPFKEAVKILWGQMDAEVLPPIDPYQEGEMSGSIRVAIASGNQEQLDGHFGSCPRYLIYQLSPEAIKLIDIRSTLEADLSDDKTASRVNLITDCHILFIVSIGGPPAARVIKSGIYPIKKSEGGAAREILADLQKVMATSPPPWLAKVVGVADGERVKNYTAVEAD